MEWFSNKYDYNFRIEELIFIYCNVYAVFSPILFHVICCRIGECFLSAHYSGSCNSVRFQQSQKKPKQDLHLNGQVIALEVAILITYECPRFLFEVLGGILFPCEVKIFGVSYKRIGLRNVY